VSENYALRDEPNRTFRSSGPIVKNFSELPSISSVIGSILVFVISGVGSIGFGKFIDRGKINAALRRLHGKVIMALSAATPQDCFPSGFQKPPASP
jgi:hypothetical protein